MRNLLGNVPEENTFILNDGSQVRNINELYDTIQSMDESVFSHHVNPERNDFYNWVNNVHKDPKLAGSLIAAQSREEMAGALKTRIDELQSVKEKEKAITSISKELNKDKITVKKIRSRKTKKSVMAKSATQRKPRGAIKSAIAPALKVEIYKSKEVITKKKPLAEVREHNKIAEFIDKIHLHFVMAKIKLKK